MKKEIKYKTIVVDEKTHDAIRLAAFKRRISLKLIVERAVNEYLKRKPEV